MCGISGSFAVQAVTLTDLHMSLGCIVHRGPDGQGVHQSGSALMGMRRLSVIDLQGGTQPIYSETGDIAVVFNGEIYNYRELREGLKARGHQFQTESDTEVLVHLYEESGERMVEALRGMFAFAIHDRRDDTLLLARDRFGKKPLYYFQPETGGLLFASELKALRPLARATGARWQINDQAIYDYLSLGVIPQPSTVYLGVQALPAGHTLLARGAQVTISAYWRPTFTPKRQLSYGEAQERVREEVAEATRLRLRSDVPLGVFLSGGVDSSVVAYEAARVLGDGLQTFTVASGGGLDESPVAARTAQSLGVRNEVLHIAPSPLESLLFLVRHYDQPYSDSSAIPSLEISRVARERVTVVLNGDGGDEVFSGYRRYVAAQRQALFAHVPAVARQGLARLLGPWADQRRSALGFAARFARGLAMSPGERFLAWTGDMLRESDKRSAWLRGPALATERRIEAHLNPELGAVDQQVEADIHLILHPGLLVKMDMATMAHSLEARSPLLDHRLAEFVWQLPEAYRVRAGRPKAVLRDAYQGRLSDEVIRGAKRGFEIPMAQWLGAELAPLLHDTLGTPNARLRGYLDGSLIDAVLRREVLTERNWAYLVYSWLVLELWLQEEGRD